MIMMIIIKIKASGAQPGEALLRARALGCGYPLSSGAPIRCSGEIMVKLW